MTKILKSNIQKIKPENSNFKKIKTQYSKTQKSKVQKIKTEKSKTSKKWNPWIIIAVELLGTFILVLGILLPTVMSFSNAEIGNWGGTTTGTASSFRETWALIFKPFIIKALWVATLIFLLVIVFIKISANFNPVVTFVEMALKKDSFGMGMGKISVQLLGGLLAAIAGWAIADAIGSTTQAVQKAAVAHPNLVNFTQTLDAVFPHISVEWNQTSLKAINEWILHDQQIAPGKNAIWVSVVMFLIEGLWTFLLLVAIFAGSYSSKARPFVIAGAVWLIVTMGIFTNNIALNPARALGPSIVADLTGQTTTNTLGILKTAGTMKYQWIFFAGQMVAGGLFSYIVYRRGLSTEVKQTKQQKNLLAQNILLRTEIHDLIKNGNQPAQLLPRPLLLKEGKRLGIKEYYKLDNIKLIEEVKVRKVEIYLTQSRKK